MWGNSGLLIYNDAYARCIAAVHPGALGRSAFDVWPDKRADFAPHFEQAMARDEVVVRDQFVPGPGVAGKSSSYDLTYTPVRNEGGSVAGVLVRLEETSDRERAEAALRESEQRQSFLLALSDELRPLRDPVAAQLAAARLLGVQLGANRVAYAEDLGDGEHVAITCNYTNGVPGIEGTYRYLDYGADLVSELRAGRAVVRPDIAMDSAISGAEKAAHAELQLSATLNIPLVKNGRLLAILAVHYTAAHAFSREEVELAVEVAERTWAAVERARAEQALRASEARYRPLFDAMDQGYLLADVIFDEADRAVDIVYVEANPAATRMMGIDLTGKRLSEVADYEPYWFEIWGRVAKSGRGERLERYAAPTGSWYDFYVFKPAAEDEVSRRVAVIFQDVTERRAHDIALRRSEERLQLATEAASLGIFDVDLTTGESDWDCRIREIWGVGEAETVTDEVFIGGVHSDDRNLVRGAVERALDPDGGHLYSAEYRVLNRETNEQRWIVAAGRA